MAANDLLTTLLRDVSRSFYLTLRVLPASIRPQIGLAYLLARATDTIADTEIVPVEQRLAALRQLRAAILASSNLSQGVDALAEHPSPPALSPHPMKGKGDRRAGEGYAPDSNVLPNSSAAPSLDELARHQGSPGERRLLERIGEALAVLNGLNGFDRKLICEALDTITSGQELDLQRFGGASTEQIVALNTDAELDDYTYRVAGCVGEFWTRMCRAHVFPHARLDDARLLADGVRFGKGLQLVNILRDLPRDLRQGRCYLPAERLAPIGLSPRDLLDAANEPRLRPLYDELLARARGHLTAGWAYTCALPWSCVRVRLACAWPVLIGLQTLDRLACGRVLGGERLKVSRADVRGVMLKTVALYPLPGVWRGLGPEETRP